MVRDDINVNKKYAEFKNKQGFGTGEVRTQITLLLLLTNYIVVYVESTLH